MLLIVAVLLAILSISLYATWQLTYTFKYYGEDVVYEGFGDKKDANNYHKISKRNYFIR